MKVVCYGQPTKQAGLAAAMQGLARLGFEVRLIDGKATKDFSAIECDFAVIEGVRSHHRYIYEAHRDDPNAPPLVIVEYGYIGRATNPDDAGGKTWQVSIDALGWVPKYPCSAKRFERLGVPIEPLRPEDDDKPIIVIGDHPGFADSVDDFRWPEFRHWAETALHEMRKHTARRVFWRPHPRQQIGIPGFSGLSMGPIDWREQWACVVYNSNSGNEALIKGCPVFTDGWAGYREVSNTDLSAIEAPKLPDREDYFHRLAHAQWFLDEIERGEPFAEYIEKGLL
jgi:hypothetical protein